jgi:chorismate mutase/prephenate dehydratase
MDNLQQIRARIDQLDEQLQKLINERASCAQEIARLKGEAWADQDYYRPEREAEVLRKVIERNNGPLEDKEVVRLFREIMSACLALQRPMTIAFLGPEGTFTQEAVYKHFGRSVSALPVASVDEVFRAVETGTAHHGVVAVENSTEGAIVHTLDLLINSPLKICGEVELRIRHCLLAKAGTLATVNVVSGHQQALAQCQHWLDNHLPHADRVAVSSNAEAARRAAQEDVTAAVAGENAATVYQLNILAQNIEDEPNNTTRFLVIGRNQCPPSGNDKTSLLFSVHNRPGALYSVLQPLGAHGISMTRIESRPSRRGTWDYVFFVDIQGHLQDEQVAAALKELDEATTLFKVLGSYPAAIQ